MTLVLALATENFSVQVSDRRLTDKDGRKVRDQNKSILLDAGGTFKIVVSYSGIAQAGNVPMHQVLHDLFARLWESTGGDPDAFLTSVTAELESRFTQKDLTQYEPGIRRFELTMSGFAHSDDGVWPVISVASNFVDPDGDVIHSEAKPTFWEKFVVVGPSGSMLVASGDYSRLPDDLKEKIIAAVEEGKPATYLRDMMAAAVGTASQDNPRIGDDVHATIINRDMSVESSYVVRNDAPAWQGIDMMKLEKDGHSLSLRDPQIVRQGGGPTVFHQRGKSRRRDE